MREPSPRGRISVHLKIAGLLATGAIIVAFAGGAVLRATASSRIEVQMAEQARIIGAAVGGAALNSPGDLASVVQSIAGDPAVSFVAVVGGEPGRVLAASEETWRGRPLSKISPVSHARAVLDALEFGQVQGSPRPGAMLTTYAAPLKGLETRRGAAGASAAVLVAFDPARAEQKLAETARGMNSVLWGAVGAIAAGAYLLTLTFVLNPLRAMRRKMETSGEQAAGEQIPWRSGDEIEALAGALEVLIASSASGEIKTEPTPAAVPSGSPTAGR